MSSAPSVRRRIYLLRHAAVSYFDEQGHPLDPRGVPLNANGREQAAAAAHMLAPVPFDLAVCSGLPRTEQTARMVLNGGQAITLHCDERLKEIRAGRLREVPAEQRERTIAYAYDDAEQPGACFIGGETWSDFNARVILAWHEWLTRPEWSNLLMVAHDAVNRVILGHIGGSGLGGLKAFEQDPACINIIETDHGPEGESRCLIRCINLAAYDPIRQQQRQTVMEQVWNHFQPNAAQPRVPAEE